MLIDFCQVQYPFAIIDASVEKFYTKNVHGFKDFYACYRRPHTSHGEEQHYVNSSNGYGGNENVRMSALNSNAGKYAYISNYSFPVLIPPLFTDDC